MMKKTIAIALSALVLVTGCSNKEQQKEQQKEETPVQQQQQESTKIENKELTEKLQNEKGVQQANVYEQDHVAIATVELEKQVTAEDAKEFSRDVCTTITKNI